MAPVQTALARDNDSIRVMVVDDSVVIRGLISRWIKETPGLEVVSTQRDGKKAVDAIEASQPDIVVLDIEMPEMDGLTALPLILKKKPGIKVIMASTLTKRNARISMQALSMGAVDYIPKPEGNHGVTTSSDFRKDLIEKVKVIGSQNRRSRPKPELKSVSAKTPAPGLSPNPISLHQSDAQLKTVPFSRVKPRILAIGSSTGGPQALTKLITEISPALGQVPTVITQHMPKTFTGILASNLSSAANRPCKEAEDGEVLKAGAIYVAPGGKHLILKKRDGAAVVKLDDGEPVNFCKPAVDPMFNSVAGIFGSASLGLVLTGMGQDGARGSVTIQTAGGSIIAQDEATSVVWGMPGATAQAGICSAVLPLDRIGQKVKELLGRGI